MNTWPYYSPALRRDVDALLKKGGSLSAYRSSSAFPSWIGPKKNSEAWKLEREIEKKFKVRHAIAVNSGTAALHAGLVSIGVRGKEVVTSPYTFSATASAILLAGGIPRFADIDPYTFCITKETVKRVITKKTTAILPVHLFGYFSDLRGLREFGLPIIEDACQAVGAVRDGVRYAGTDSSAGAISFNGSKNIPSGEGGAVLCSDDKLARKLRLFINHQENFGAKEVSPNYRIQEVVALIARHGLQDLDERNQRRIDLSYKVMCPDNKFLILPVKDKSHVFYIYPFLVEKNRDPFIKQMVKRGIPVQAGYTQPLHTLPAFRKYQTKPMLVVEEVHKKLCLLTTLTPDKPLSYAKKVAAAIRESLS